jgi:hypothetical protein
MHGPIRDRLEDLLRGRGYSSVAGHLADCAECSTELDAMKQQCGILAGLRASEIEPAAGFYARVLQRIEDGEIGSFWAFFVDSPFSKRLAFASLTVALALGSYVVSQESRERTLAGGTIIAYNGGSHQDVPVMGDRAEQRDAVLTNFAVHPAAVSLGQIQ